MKYPNCKDYRAMYQKYINRKNLLEMLDLAGEYKDKIFLDLCCGDGAAAREAILRGAEKCFIVDTEYKMIAEDLVPGKDKIAICTGAVQDFIYFTESKKWKFDIVFCRQGINYWYDPIHMQQIAKLIEDEGVFIFNTFNTKPTREPMVKEYDIEGVHFAEISYLVGNREVHHVQIRDEFPPHVTQFKWFSEEDFKLGLVDHFDYEIRRRNNTDVYICRKKIK